MAKMSMRSTNCFNKGNSNLDVILLLKWKSLQASPSKMDSNKKQTRNQCIKTETYKRTNTWCPHHHMITNRKSWVTWRMTRSITGCRVRDPSTIAVNNSSSRSISTRHTRTTSRGRETTKWRRILQSINIQRHSIMIQGRSYGPKWLTKKRFQKVAANLQFRNHKIRSNMVTNTIEIRSHQKQLQGYCMNRAA